MINNEYILQVSDKNLNEWSFVSYVHYNLLTFGERSLEINLSYDIKERILEKKIDAAKHKLRLVDIMLYDEKPFRGNHTSHIIRSWVLSSDKGSKIKSKKDGLQKIRNDLKEDELDEFFRGIE